MPSSAMLSSPMALAFWPMARGHSSTTAGAGDIRVCEMADDGTVSGGHVWVCIAGEGEGAQDGMKCTVGEKTLGIGASGEHALCADGETPGVIRTPEQSTSFCNGGVDFPKLCIAASTSACRFPTRLTGLAVLRR